MSALREVSVAEFPSKRADKRVQRWLVALLAALGVDLALGVTEPARSAEESPKTFAINFRGQGLSSAFRSLADEDRQFVREEPQGLRITPSRERMKKGPLGVTTEFGVHGDFDIMATYEILYTEVPTDPKCWGVGVTLKVGNADIREWANMTRLRKPIGGEVVFWDRSLVPPKQPRFIGGQLPCTDKVLRLRLKRVGPTLHYQWAAGVEGDDFNDLHIDGAGKEFGTNDLSGVTMNVATGSMPYELDIRILDFRVQAESLPGLTVPAELPTAAPPQDGEEQKPKSNWLPVAVGLLGLLVVLAFLMALGLWLYRRQTRDTEKLPALSVAPDAPVEAAAPPVSFTCSCGKNLKAKATLAGRKVKCSQCGQPVLVPQAEPRPLGSGRTSSAP